MKTLINLFKWGVYYILDWISRAGNIILKLFGYDSDMELDLGWNRKPTQGNRKPTQGNRKPMKKKAKTYTFSWWIGGDYVTLTFNSMEDMHKCLDYIENKFPERIKDQMPVEEVCNILGKKLAKLEEVANKLKDIK